MLYNLENTVHTNPIILSKWGIEKMYQIFTIRWSARYISTRTPISGISNLCPGCHLQDDSVQHPTAHQSWMLGVPTFFAMLLPEPLCVCVCVFHHHSWATIAQTHDTFQRNVILKWKEKISCHPVPVMYFSKPAMKRKVGNENNQIQEAESREAPRHILNAHRMLHCSRN